MGIKLDEVIKRYKNNAEYERTHGNLQGCLEFRQHAEWLEELKQLKQLKEQTRWIPVSERPPRELEPVNITWVNHNPESYYADIKDKPFTATGVYFNGQWYWWSVECVEILAEYSHNYHDVIDSDIEVIAWMPLPEPYKPESEVEDGHK